MMGDYDQPTVPDLLSRSMTNAERAECERVTLQIHSEAAAAVAASGPKFDFRGHPMPHDGGAEREALFRRAYEQHPNPRCYEKECDRLSAIEERLDRIESALRSWAKWKP